MRRRKQIARRRGITVGLLLLAALILGTGWWQARVHTPVPAVVRQVLVEFLAPALRAGGGLRNRMTPDPHYTTDPLTPVGLARLRAIEEENQRLRALLTLRDRQPTAGVVVEIIARPRMPWQGDLTVDKGSRAGVMARMVALTPDGVLGQVIDVTPTTAQIRPLTDRASGIGAMIARTKAPGVLKGDRDGQCRLVYLSGQADVQVGDQVVTSGLGHIFPPGLPLGRVTAVTQDAALSSRVAAVAPAANPATAEMAVLLRVTPDAR